MNQTHTTPTNLASGDTHEIGYAFVSSSLEPYYVGKIDAKAIYELTSNLYVAGPVRQTANLVLGDDPMIEVFDNNGDPVENLSRELNVMFNQLECSLPQVVRSSLSDCMNWGISVYNWVWKREDGRLVCKSLNRVHPYNLSQAPSAPISNATFGRLLEGIVYDKSERKVHYYHRQDSGIPFEIPEQDLLVVRDPSSDYPDGNSIIYPIAPILEFVNYAWNALGQQMFRVGAPIIFIKITKPNPERVINGVRIPSDVEYANQIMENWGKDRVFNLRENFELVRVDVSEGSLAVKAIDFAQTTIRDYLNPNGMLGKDGSLISGNSDASLRLLNNSIRGWISLLETALSAIPQYYLKYNGYPSSYHAKVRIPQGVVEDWGRKLQIAQIGINSRTLTVNEVRELLGREGLSDEELAKIDYGWKTVMPPATPVGSLGIPEMFANSSGQDRVKDRSKLSRECAIDLIDGVDRLEHKIHAAIRNEMKK